MTIGQDVGILKIQNVASEALFADHYNITWYAEFFFENNVWIINHLTNLLYSIIYAFYLNEFLNENQPFYLYL